MSRSWRKEKSLSSLTAKAADLTLPLIALLFNSAFEIDPVASAEVNRKELFFV